MSQSPGHKRSPEHTIRSAPVGERVVVKVDGQILADSHDALRVTEDHHPARYYFPRSDVKMDKLRRAARTSECPFKGTAHYFDISLGGKTLEGAVWSYEDPYDEHRDLQERLAFYDDKMPEITISPSA